MNARGPLPRVMAPLTAPASWLYRAGVAWRNRRFDRTTPWRGSIPVIAVGNVSVGGTGKSPVVRWVVRQLRDAGCRPGIVLRGYRRAEGDVGDEAREHGRLLGDVPIVVDPDRRTGIEALVRGGADCAVLDDAFQHRRVARDLDVVLVDARRGLDDRLLPHGWQREPARALARADLVVVTHGDSLKPELAGIVEAAHGSSPIAVTRHAWVNLQASNGDVLDTAWLDGKRVVVSAGIGQPAVVVDQARALGADVSVVPAADHQAYDKARVATLRERTAGADALLVTLKDWVKLEPAITPAPLGCPVVWPELAIEFISGEEPLRDRIVATCRQANAAAQ